MPKRILVALFLITVGLIAFNDQDSAHRTREKALDSGAVQVIAAKTKTIPMPRLAGLLALSAGVFLLFMNKPLKA